MPSSELSRFAHCVWGCGLAVAVSAAGGDVVAHGRTAVSKSTTTRVTVPPSHPHIRYTGRVDLSRPYRARFDWPGISFDALFDGTSCAVRLNGQGGAYNVYVDGVLHKVLRTDSSMSVYELAVGLPDTLHRLTVSKRFEHEGAIPEFRGLLLDKDKSLHPLPPPPRFRIEFIGASYVAGWGNESHSLKCASVGDSSNCLNSFGPLAARELGAECFVIAASGKGVVRNWATPFITARDPFPTYYGRTLRNASTPHWEHTRWVPQIVVMSLGANDFSTRPPTPRALFTAHYLALIDLVRDRYPGVEIVCLTSQREPFRTYVQAIVDSETRRGARDVYMLWYSDMPVQELGCDWHPVVEAHRRIAHKLASTIRGIMAHKERPADLPGVGQTFSADDEGQ